jgi:RNA polymerase sigma factor (TIGR02999 family)
VVRAGGYTHHRAAKANKAPAMNELTQILCAIEHGEPHAVQHLWPLVYEELRNLAGRKLAQENPGQTLQATALVHEAYLRLTAGEQVHHWKGRAHFFRAAAEAMRRILVDRAREKRSQKRGGAWKRVDLDSAAAVCIEPVEDVAAIHEALEKLAQHNPVKAELVQLRYFAGLSVEQAAEVLQISRATADRYWRYAKTWLYCALSRSHPAEPA